MQEIPANLVTIRDDFWSPRLQVNATRAIDHQWEQLEKSGCLDNFRILAGLKDGFREGWVFADSDAYKWLDAAARIYAAAPRPLLAARMDELLALLGAVQTPDGYIFTFNQIHFPGQRWVNLQIEHELYCHGHLIEACISHHQATGQDVALRIAEKAAALLLKDFLQAPPEMTDGHEEIELALLRLSTHTGNTAYRDLARHFLESRGTIPQYGRLYQEQMASYQQRKTEVNRQRDHYAAAHPGWTPTRLPPDNESKNPPHSRLRRVLNARSGKYTQQHAPLRQQTSPEGHAVRYGYLQSATAMLQRLENDQSLRPALEASWERLVTRRMYVTGGLGALPGNEGFGNDYELDPEYAYAETCAALASIFWNWEMALSSAQPRYSDLLEWQLYNAAAPGMGLDGDTYLYNNPLKVQGGIERRAWYSVPCCPSNLSRTWAALNRYIYAAADEELWVHQYIGSVLSLASSPPATLTMQTGLPWDGQVSLRFDLPTPRQLGLHLRLPSWAGQCAASLNGAPLKLDTPPLPAPRQPAAQGYDPRLARFANLRRLWQPGDELALQFELPIRLRRAHPRVTGHAGLVAVTRGPLVYCLENLDQPGLDIFNCTLDPASLRTIHRPDLLGGVTTLAGLTTRGEPLTFIPYSLWGNRGPSQMCVWLSARPQAGEPS